MRPPPIPGVSEAIQHGDAPTAAQQLQELTAALARAAEMLESYKFSDDLKTGK